MNWEKIETAPRDGQPVWARGHDYGNEENAMHVGWVYFNDDRWLWAGGSATEGGHAAHVIEWLPRPAGVLQ